MKDPDGVVLIMCRVGGTVPPDSVVRLDITALETTPDHIREALVSEGVRRVQREYPEAQDVKMIEEWGEFEFAAVEERA